MTDLVFRNVDASPDQPVSEWPLEGIQAALERGSLTYWRRLAKAIQAEPWGPVAAEISRLVDESGLTRAEFASRIGTSTPPPLDLCQRQGDPVGVAAAADEGRGRRGARI